MFYFIFCFLWFWISIVQNTQTYTSSTGKNYQLISKKNVQERAKIDPSRLMVEANYKKYNKKVIAT